MPKKKFMEGKTDNGTMHYLRRKTASMKKLFLALLAAILVIGSFSACNPARKSGCPSMRL
jgi:hypothetical protein